MKYLLFVQLVLMTIFFGSLAALLCLHDPSDAPPWLERVFYGSAVGLLACVGISLWVIAWCGIVGCE